jgi:hypothetical protein
MKTRTLLHALSLAIAGLGGVACSSGGSDSHSVEQTGTIEATLTAVGPDGATYALSPSAFLQLTWTNEGGLQNQALLFNSTSPTQSFSVAPATYTATLFNATPLTRIADSGPTSVSATLVDPQPYKFTVTAGQTTSLTLHYTITGIGDLTFSTGTVSTHLQVDAATASPGHLLVQGSGSVSPGLNGPSGLNMALASSGPVALSYSITATLTSPFAAGIESTCANITGTVSASTDSSGNDPNYAAFFDEASGGNGVVCIYDANSPAFPGQVVVFLERFGAPQTSAMISALGAAAQPGEGFAVQVIGSPTPPLYDGATLHLSQFSQPLTFPGFEVSVQYQPTNTQLGNLVGSPVGPMTLQVTP